MAVDARSIKQFAQSLIDGEQAGEVEFRTAASKAYYSAFHLVRHLEDQSPGDPPEGVYGVHEKLCYQLTKNPPSGVQGGDKKKIKQLGAILRQIKDVRAKADYDVDKDFLKEEATDVMTRVDRLFTTYHHLEYLQAG